MIGILNGHARARSVSSCPRHVSVRRKPMQNLRRSSEITFFFGVAVSEMCRKHLKLVILYFFMSTGKHTGCTGLPGSPGKMHENSKAAKAASVLALLTGKIQNCQLQMLPMSSRGTKSTNQGQIHYFQLIVHMGIWGSQKTKKDFF